MKHLIALIVLITLPAFAGDRTYIKQSNDMNNQTAGDINVGGNAQTIGDITMTPGDVNVSGGSTTMNSDSKAFAFAHSLGDVDINQCIVTKQTGTIVISWQGYDYNLWCMGEVFDAKGLYRMGALMRCDIPAIRVHFADDDSCVAANEVTPRPEPVAVITPAFEEHEEREDAHDEQLAMQRQEIEQIESKLSTYDRAIERAQRKERQEKQFNAEFLEKYKEVAGSE